MIALDLTQHDWTDAAPSFRLLGGGHYWVDAERIGRLVRLTRIAETPVGPKVIQYFVHPSQPVVLTIPVRRHV